MGEHVTVTRQAISVQRITKPYRVMSIAVVTDGVLSQGGGSGIYSGVSIVIRDATGGLGDRRVRVSVIGVVGGTIPVRVRSRTTVFRTGIRIIEIIGGVMERVVFGGGSEVVQPFGIGRCSPPSHQQKHQVVPRRGLYVSLGNRRREPKTVTIYRGGIPSTTSVSILSGGEAQERLRLRLPTPHRGAGIRLRSLFLFSLGRVRGGSGDEASFSSPIR